MSGAAKRAALLVTDDGDFARATRDALESTLDARVTRCETVAAALECIDKEQVGVVVCDHAPPELDGLGLVATLRERDPDLPVVLAPRDGSERLASRAIAAGATDYVVRDERAAEAIAERVAAIVDASGPSADEELRTCDRLTDDAELYRLTLANITDTVLLTDGEGALTYVCPNVSAIFGYTPATVEAMGTVDALLGGDPIPESLGDDQVVSNVEHQVRDEDGRTHDVLVTCKRVDFRDAERLYSIRDVTDRKEQERRFQALVEHSSDVIAVSDADATITYVSPAIEHVFGYDADDVVGRSLLEFVHPDDYDTVVSIVDELREAPAGTRRTERYRLVTAGGDARWAEVATTKRPDLPDGEYVTNARDVTERVERERQLEDVEMSRSVALEAANAGVWQWEPDTGRFRLDSSSEELLDLGQGAPPATLDEFLDSVHQADVEGLRAALERTARRGETFDRRFRLDSGDGMTRWMESRGQRHAANADDAAHIHGVLVDVTEREERLRHLQVLDRLLRHNLRNDLSVVRSYAESIGAKTDGELATYADRIIAQTDDLLTETEKQRQITGVLSSRPAVEPVALAPIVEAVVDRARDRYPAADVEASVPPGATVWATAELDLAIEELVRNAIVHNDRAKPTVRIRADVTEGGVDVTVADDGPPIPPVEREVVTGEREETQLYHGSGLGLWLVYWVLQRSGGTIGFADGDPRGNQVTVHLERYTDDAAVGPTRRQQ